MVESEYYSAKTLWENNVFPLISAVPQVSARPQIIPEPLTLSSE